MMSKLLAMAIALVVGLQFGPDLVIPNAPMAAVSSLEPGFESDTLKLGERLEPRVFPSSVLHRLAPTPAPQQRVPAMVDDIRMAAYAKDPEKRREDKRFAIATKHVPRMDGGEPPRV
jgi:hypothetical protein